MSSFSKPVRGMKKDLKCLRVVKCKAGSYSARPAEGTRVYVKYGSVWVKV